eukprot:5200537-Pleurochrysis_carterae.AAC.1
MLSGMSCRALDDEGLKTPERSSAQSLRCRSKGRGGWSVRMRAEQRPGGGGAMRARAPAPRPSAAPTARCELLPSRDTSGDPAQYSVFSTDPRFGRSKCTPLKYANAARHSDI